ncbi:hypothetical protein [Aliarcobacter butzleri]|uniref:hypothetical protein n=1 Tax=Aliarcobacter butzleri TaxID=28197 RepID=UPI002B240320|nr:hypothetical protein [Aliarcobacter butzleri]
MNATYGGFVFSDNCYANYGDTSRCYKANGATYVNIGTSYGIDAITGGNLTCVVASTNYTCSSGWIKLNNSTCEYREAF